MLAQSPLPTRQFFKKYYMYFYYAATKLKLALLVKIVTVIITF